MSKFNQAGTKSAPVSLRGTSAVHTVSTAPDTRTAEGAVGWTRDNRSALFLATVSAFVTEATFYESADDRVERIRELSRTVALEADADGNAVGVAWLTEFVRWLRREGNIRTASIVIAAEAVRGRTQAHLDSEARELVAAAIDRADEPGELLSYWLARYGRPIPNSIKRGIDLATRRIYSERSLLRYDTDRSAVRFGDVVQLTHPTPKDARQSDLFRHAIERRTGWGDGEVPATLEMVQARAALEAVPVAARRALVVERNGVPISDRLAAAGVSWEYLSGWLADGKGMDAAAWEAVIPSMGYMALLRNVRNFEKAAVSSTVLDSVAARLSDPAEVAKSRQFPFRFLSAYQANEGNLRWAWPLEQALNHSLANVPSLSGRTLVLVDRSPSMWGETFSKHSTMPWADAAAVFGAALALRAEYADMVEFGHDNRPIPFKAGESVLKVVGRFGRESGTDIPSAVAKHYRRDFHDRVVIVTDEQTRPGWLPSNGGGYYGGMGPTPINDLVPAQVPLIMWNFGGYTASAMPSGQENRHVFAGLTDAAFWMLELVERGTATGWPWEDAAAGRG